MCVCVRARDDGLHSDFKFEVEALTPSVSADLAQLFEWFIILFLFDRNCFCNRTYAYAGSIC